MIFFLKWEWFVVMSLCADFFHFRQLFKKTWQFLGGTKHCRRQWNLPSNNRTASFEGWGAIGYANRRRKQLRLEKKTLKRHFHHFSHKHCYRASKLQMEINSSKALRTLQSPVFPWCSDVSFLSRLALWSWLRMGRGLTYLPMQILFVTVCEAKSFGSHFFNYLLNDLHSRFHLLVFPCKWWQKSN